MPLSVSVGRSLARSLALFAPKSVRLLSLHHPSSSANPFHLSYLILKAAQLPEYNVPDLTRRLFHLSLRHWRPALLPDHASIFK